MAKYIPDNTGTVPRDIEPGGDMTDYRLYLLTRDDRIDRGIVLSCEGDEHAIAEMDLHIVAAEGGELWRGSQLLRRVAPVASTGSDQVKVR